MARPNTTAPVSADRLVSVALGVLREFGMADLTMRRLAKELEVQPSALYWHVKDKQSLLALIADRLLGDVILPDLTGNIKQDLRRRAEILHHALLDTRDAAELVASVVALGSGGHSLRSYLLDAAVQNSTEHATHPPESDPHPHTLVDAICSLLLGSALVEQQRAQAAELGIKSTLMTPLSDFSIMLRLLT